MVAELAYIGNCWRVFFLKGLTLAFRRAVGVLGTRTSLHDIILEVGYASIRYTSTYICGTRKGREDIWIRTE
jgi:hypothetical protein